MKHIIPTGPADTARIATVYCEDIEAWDTLANMIAFETVPGCGEYGMGNSGLADVAEAVCEMEPQAQAPADIPAGAPRSRVYFRNGRSAAAFQDAMESLGAARVADNEPGAIYVPARLARAMADQING